MAGKMSNSDCLSRTKSAKKTSDSNGVTKGLREKMMFGR
jgi:hypothetical protein